MTLRWMLGGDVQRIQEQVDDLLDSEDGWLGARRHHSLTGLQFAALI